MTSSYAPDPDYRDFSRRARRLTAALREFESLSLAVSHDFRVPLRMINEAARAISEARSSSVDPETRRGVRAVRDGLGLIEAMMADLDEFCCSGVRPLALEVVDMQALVCDVWKRLDRREGISFAVGRLPAARGDREMLRIVWRHLLGTAAARCASGHGRIDVNGSDGAAFSVYSVHDNGTDLALDFPGKLHHSFEQIQMQSMHPGSGVALAIVQRLVTRHRGNVWVEASPEKGTLFQFSIGEAEASGS
jgi:light-regulated signal transduction histidine kinase (bacteriophytochrome)